MSVTIEPHPGYPGTMMAKVVGEQLRPNAFRAYCSHSKFDPVQVARTVKKGDLPRYVAGLKKNFVTIKMPEGGLAWTAWKAACNEEARAYATQRAASLPPPVMAYVSLSRHPNRQGVYLAEVKDGLLVNREPALKAYLSYGKYDPDLGCRLIPEKDLEDYNLACEEADLEVFFGLRPKKEPENRVFRLKPKKKRRLEHKRRCRRRRLGLKKPQKGPLARLGALLRAFGGAGRGVAARSGQVAVKGSLEGIVRIRTCIIA